MKKKLIIITFLIAGLIYLNPQTLSKKNVIITHYSFKEIQNVKSDNYSDLYKEWLLLSEEDRKRVPEPPKTVSNFVSSKSSLKTETYAMYLPSQYDLRNVNGNSYVTSVKDQGQTNLCWAFVSSSALESNILMNGGNSYNFNPLHSSNSLAYKFLDYNNPYGNKDINSGGNYSDSLQYWASGLGPITTFSGDGVNELLVSDTFSDTPNIKVNEMYSLPYFDINENSDEDLREHINSIKKEIMINGGVLFSAAAPKSVEGKKLAFNDGSTYSCKNPYNSKNNSVYTDNELDFQCAPHGMLIIGWDDNFSKDNFNTGSETGNKPKQNGAWIVQNSWGTTRSHVYYSYEDYNLNRWLEVVSDTSVIEYDYIYQYNPTGKQLYYGPSSVGGINIFDKSKDIELLDEVSFYLSKNNDGDDNDISYEIYVNSENGDIDNMKLVKSQTNAFGKDGYYTVKLDEPIRLKGERFAIKVILDNANIAVSKKSNNLFPNDESVGIIDNQGYIIFDDDYIIDVSASYDAGYAVQIKAFTKKEISDSTPNVNTVLKNKDIEFPIDNQKITIKSITNNIPTSTMLDYKIKDSNNNDVTRVFNIEKNIVISNLAISVLQLTNEVEEDIYTIETLYNGEVLDIDILNLADFDIRTDKYKIDEKMVISKIKDNLLYEDFIKDFEVNPNIRIKIYKNNNEIDYSQPLGTGYKLKTYFNDILRNEYILSVSGDLNSDGTASVTDVAKLYQHFRGNQIMTEDLYIDAGNVIGNTQEIKLNDVAKLYQYVKGKIERL